MIASLRSTTMLLIKTRCTTSWTRSWTLFWGRWSKRFRLWKRSTRTSWASYLKNAASAIIWLTWTFRTTRLLRTRQMLASTLVASQRLSLLSINSNSSKLFLDRLIRLWRTVTLIRDRVQYMHLQNSNSSWTTSTRRSLLKTLYRVTSQRWYLRTPVSMSRRSLWVSYSSLPSQAHPLGSKC